MPSTTALLEPILAILLPVLGVAALAVVGVWLLKRLFGAAPIERSARGVRDVAFDPRAMFERRDALFTAAERTFLDVLEEAVGDTYRVFGKVRVLDVIEPAARLSFADRTSAMNRIDRKHLDFVLCDPASLRIVMAVELDDASHRRPGRRRRDELVDGALATAGVPLRRVAVAREYSVEGVRRALGLEGGVVTGDGTGRTGAERVGAEDRGTDRVVAGRDGASVKIGRP